MIPLPSLIHECSQKPVSSPAIEFAIAEAMVGLADLEERCAERGPRRVPSCRIKSSVYVWHLVPRVQRYPGPGKTASCVGRSDCLGTAMPSHDSGKERTNVHISPVIGL